jgi:arsenate reductase
MAEALLRHLGGPRFEVASAGYEAHDVNPLVIEAMAQIGVPLDTTARQATVFDLFKQGRYFNYVISVCDEEQGERCPIFAGVVERITWSFPDPSTFTGTRAERLARIVEVRDAIRLRIEAWLETLRPDPSA